MNKPWLSRYPRGVAHEVDVLAYTSLCDMLDKTCARFGDQPAFTNMGTVLSYRELDQHSHALAAYLQQGLGLAKGERVAIMMPNLLQYPVALFGVLRAGGVVVNVNPQYTATELEHQLRDAGAGVVIVLENFAHTLQEVLERNPEMRPQVITTQVGDLFPVVKEVFTNLVVKHVKHMVPAWTLAHTEFNAALRAGRGMALQAPPLGPQDLAFLQYTGGTTGVAKGAMLTHGNLVANVMQVAAWLAPQLREGAETLICPLPLYHVYALTSCLVFLKLGANTVLITNPRDMTQFIHELQHHPFTAIVGVNTLYRALLQAPGFEQVSFAHLRMASAGGMAVQHVVAQRWRAATGVPLVEGYGLTETSPVVISNPITIAEWSGNIGVPMPSTEAIVLDDDDTEVPQGQVGEICVRGPQVMAGYWQRPDETAKVMAPGGWLRTGDMGFMDEHGCFTITDRKKDMIIVSGFKVFPNQIEDVVTQHPGVAEAAAVGEPSESSGEVVKIVVVRQDPALTEQDLLAYCRQHLTGYKLPRVVEFRDEPLPKTALGKILRRELRAPRAPRSAQTGAA